MSSATFAAALLTFEAALTAHPTVKTILPRLPLSGSFGIRTVPRFMLGALSRRALMIQAPSIAMAARSDAKQPPVQL
ncbi:hypothetical protein AJ87_41015 [Rhizobium yanglingense]|nr:hypothetical protein AJ87_41015 [Rhizobium yanglingense]